MPRKALILTDSCPYHVFNRSNNKELFYLGLEDLWSIFEEKLIYLTKNYKCNIHSFVLMGNHYHLILDTPEMNLGEAMKYFHREVARCSNRMVNRENHFFGGRYKWCLVNSETYYWNVLKYVYRNPVKAKIVNRVEAYKFSTLNRTVKFQLNYLYVPEDFDRSKICIKWLNTPFVNEQEESIENGLRRREFRLSKSKNGWLVGLDAARLGKGTVTPRGC